MGKLIPFNKLKQKKAIQSATDQLAIFKANKKLKEHAGVDFLAIILGDNREMQRLNMKQYEYAMEERKDKH